MTQKKMDHAAELAEKDLRGLLEKTGGRLTFRSLARWWKFHLYEVGHKRLRRIVLKIEKELETNG